MIFKSDEVTSENHWQIASWVIQKSLFTVTNVLFHFLYAILCPEHTILLTTIIDRSFRKGRFWLRIVTSPKWLCDVTRTRDTSIVTSYSSIVLARANWRKGDLHWWITTVNIDFSSPDIHGLACKKTRSLGWYRNIFVIYLVVIHTVLPHLSSMA